MRSGNDAYIDLHRRITTDTVELSIGQNAQQTGLYVQRHIADFIEEQRTAIGLFETTLTYGIGAGKRPFLMAKQLRFNQVLGQDRALSDWEGVWQSVNPYLLNGDLDPVLEQKAKKPGGKSVEEYRAYYKKGYATDVEQIGIEDDVIEFHVGQTVNSCKYRYSGYKILH